MLDAKKSVASSTYFGKLPPTTSVRQLADRQFTGDIAWLAIFIILRDIYTSHRKCATYLSTMQQEDNTFGSVCLSGLQRIPLWGWCFADLWGAICTNLQSLARIALAGMSIRPSSCIYHHTWNTVQSLCLFVSNQQIFLIQASCSGRSPLIVGSVVITNSVIGFGVFCRGRANMSCLCTVVVEWEYIYIH